MSKKSDFLAELESKLEEIPEQERSEAIAYYSKMIDEYMEGGYTEEIALSALPRIDDIAEQILLDPSLPRRKMNPHSNRESIYDIPKRQPLRKLKLGERLLLILTFPIWGALALIAALLFVSFFVLCILLIVASYAIDFALAAVAIAALLCAPVPAILQTGIPWILLLLGIAFLCGGLSILLLQLSHKLSIYLLRLCRYMFYRNVAKFRQRRTVA